MLMRRRNLLNYSKLNPKIKKLMLRNRADNEVLPAEQSGRQRYEIDSEKIPRKLGKLDPTIPSEGTRPTYFTSLSTRSFESIKSLSRRPFLEKYMTIRVKPAKLVVLDYEPNSQQECVFTILNYSKKIQYISLGNTSTRLFSLGKEAPMSEFSIAPGLEKKIKVIFNAPPLADSETSSDSASKLYLDRLEIQIRGGKCITVPMEAFPPASKLEFPKSIDLGTLQINKQSLSEWEAFGENSNRVRYKKEFEQNRKEKIQSGWIKKKFLLSTLGKRPAKFSFEFDQARPLKVHPPSGVLGGDSGTYITLEYLPIHSGKIDEKIKVRLENNVPSPNERMGSKNLSHILVHGNVIERKVHLSTPRGLDILESKVLDFGSVYYGQNVSLPVIVKNQDSKRLNWNLSLSNKNQSNVPKFLIKDKSEEGGDSANEADLVFTAIPSEGILEPGETNTIYIAFQPKSLIQLKKFKSQPVEVESNAYQVSMRFETLQTTANIQDSPIDIQFKGTALPLLIKFSEDSIVFPRHDEAKNQRKTIKITNYSTELGASFAFEKFAHFSIEPSFGNLLPLESIDLRISFRPNQYGHFQIISKCIAKPYSTHVHSDDQSLSHELISQTEIVFSNLSLSLAGTWLPSILPKDLIQDIGKQAIDCLPPAQIQTTTEEIVKPSTVEWKQKVAHRQLYIDYIRGEGALKPRSRENIESLKQNIFSLRNREEEKSRPNSVDISTGLIPPEPFTRNLISRRMLRPKEDDLVDNNENDLQMKKLFQKLAEPTVLKPKHFSELGLSPHWAEEILSAKDLEKIYSSSSVLDFGEVTVHSMNKLPLNFLNVNPSKKPIHISHSFGGDIKMIDTSILTINPPILKIGAQDTGGIEVILNPHVLGSLSVTLCYIINKRYIYHVLVKAKIINIDINCSAKRLDLCITDDDLLEKQDEKQLDKSNAEDRFLDQEFAMPISLQSRKKSFSMVENGKEYTFPFTESSFSLTNAGNYRAFFEITDSQNLSFQPEKDLLNSNLAEGNFVVEPSSGFIEAKSDIPIIVRYVPGTKIFSDRIYNILVYDCYNHGKILLKKMDIAIHGSSEQSICHLFYNPKQGPLDFGTLPLGSKDDSLEFYDSGLTALSKSSTAKFPIKGIKTIRIKNEGAFSHAFVAFSSKKSSDIDISPHCGIILEDKTLELTVSILPTAVGPFNDEIIINLIGGGKSFKIPFKYDCKKSHLELTPMGQVLSNSSVIIGSSSSRTFCVLNSGNVFARMIFDLTKFPEFSMASRDDKRNINSALSGRSAGNRVSSAGSTSKSAALTRSTSKAVGFSGSTTEASRMGEIRLDSASKGRSSLVSAPFFSAVSTQYSRNRVGKLPYTNIFVVDSHPGDKFFLELIYAPKMLNKFIDPISGMVLGTRFHYDCETNFHSIPSPLILSTKVLEFEEKIIHPDGKEKSPYIKHIEMENISSSSISWNTSISGSFSDASSFILISRNGKIAPGKKETLEVRFNPNEPGSYNATLNILLETESDAIIPIHMKGIAMKPCIYFETQDIFFPVVPLGKTSQAVFWIFNAGCDSGNIIAEIPSEIKRHDILFELSFPEGRLLKENGSLPCLVQFTAKSKKPISFTIRIPFQDPESSKYYVTLHGTSDYSDITNFPYSLNNALIPQSTRISPKFYLQKREFTTPGGIIIYNQGRKDEVEKSLSRLFQTLAFWLNEPFGQQINNFPDAFTKTLGAPVISLIHYFGGKKAANLSTASKNVFNDVKLMIKHFNDILNFLIIHGGLLSNIKAEFLLSIEDFRTFSQFHESQKHNISQLNTNGNSNLQEKIQNFSVISREAWCFVILQILRIFVFPATGGALLKILSEEDQNEINFQLQSNYSSYSNTTDATLLAWASLIFKRETGNVSCFTDLVNDFKDSKIYRSLILHHVPSCQKIFHQFYSTPQTDEQREINATSVKKALINIFGDTPWSLFNEKNICNGNELDHRFLLLFLYQTLPFFIPKTEIVFIGQLHEFQTRSIEISNNSTRSITYSAILTGAKEFHIHDSSFTVPPKSTFSFQIDFKSRFARQSEGVITIKTKKSTLGSSNILAFKLLAVAPTLIPIQTIRTEAPVYCSPPMLVKIEVKNPFMEAANFKLLLSQTNSIVKFKVKNFENVEEKVQIPGAFTLQAENLNIAAGKTGEFHIYFLPFEMGEKDCFISLHDPEVGEFMISVKGTGLIPHPLDQTSFIGTSGISMDKTIRISSSNSLREKALHTFLNLNYYRNNASKSRTSARDRSKSFEYKDFCIAPKQPLTYQVKYLSPFITGSSEIILKPSNGDKSKLTGPNEGNYSELPICFSPQTSGKYICQILLSCVEFPEYRLVILNGLARSEGSTADLEFKTQAKKVIQQDIPIINQTEEDWPIRAVLTGDYFSSPYVVTAKAGSRTNFPVIFRPRKRCEVIGCLVLSNSCTNQKYTYNLKGIGLEPDPVDYIQLSCTCREKQSLRLMVANDTDAASTYDIITDLSVVNGNRTIDIPAGSRKFYEIEFMSLHSGNLTKFIKFYNPDDESFSWYSIDLHVSPAPPDYSLSLECVIRESRTVEIELKNPLQDKSITYKISISGNCLTGKHEISVPLNGSVSYKLQYSPLIPGTSKGLIRFSNAEIGEFSYELQLIAHDAKAKQLDMIQCPLGKSKSIILEISNPLGAEVILEAKVSDPSHFQVFIPPILPTDTPKRSHEMIKKILVDRYQTIPAQLVYWPSNVEEINEAILEFTNPSLGSINFNCSGMGIKPVEMNTLSIVCPMGDSKGGTIEFDNPFFESAHFEISLEQSSDENVFTLLNSLKSRYVGGLESTSIQITYKPGQMIKSKAFLTIEANQKYKWIYPIEGFPEMHGSLIQLKSRVRERTDQIFDIQISSMPFINAEKGKKVNWSSYFRIELVGNSVNDKNWMENTLSVKVLETTVTDSTTLSLKLLFQFLPSKLLDAKIQLSFINIDTGSLWKFPIQMVATVPHIDDTIIIQGDSKKVSTVCFNLKNPYERRLKFKAFFNGKRPPTDLTVTPTEGTLAPSSATSETDNQFFVSFSPLQNGKSSSAMLVIETDEFALFYDIKGITPLVKKK